MIANREGKPVVHRIKYPRGIGSAFPVPQETGGGGGSAFAVPEQRPADRNRIVPVTESGGGSTIMPVVFPSGDNREAEGEGARVPPRPPISQGGRLNERQRPPRAGEDITRRPPAEPDRVRVPRGPDRPPPRLGRDIETERLPATEMGEIEGRLSGPLLPNDPLPEGIGAEDRPLLSGENPEMLPNPPNNPVEGDFPPAEPAGDFARVGVRPMQDAPHLPPRRLRAEVPEPEATEMGEIGEAGAIVPPNLPAPSMPSFNLPESMGIPADMWEELPEISRGPPMMSGLTGRESETLHNVEPSLSTRDVSALDREALGGVEPIESATSRLARMMPETPSLGSLMPSGQTLMSAIRGRPEIGPVDSFWSGGEGVPSVRSLLPSTRTSLPEGLESAIARANRMPIVRDPYSMNYNTGALGRSLRLTRSVLRARDIGDVPNLDVTAEAPVSQVATAPSTYIPPPPPPASIAESMAPDAAEAGEAGEAEALAEDAAVL